MEKLRCVFLPRYFWNMKKCFWISGGPDVTQNLLARLVRAENVVYTSIFFNFNAVTKDLDDNKFADAFLAANADYIVSNDAALLALNSSEFPPFQVLTLQAFSAILSAQ